jgi:hypothetical protein
LGVALHKNNYYQSKISGQAKWFFCSFQQMTEANRNVKTVVAALMCELWDVQLVGWAEEHRSLKVNISYKASP